MQFSRFMRGVAFVLAFALSVQCTAPTIYAQEYAASVALLEKAAQSSSALTEENASTEAAPPASSEAASSSAASLPQSTPAEQIADASSASSAGSDVASDDEKPDITAPSSTSEDASSRTPVTPPIATIPGTEAGASSAELDHGDKTGPPITIEGEICIYNAAQLRAIGTNSAVTSADYNSADFGTGEPVLGADGAAFVYSLSANYRMMNNIPLDSAALWQWPADFAGTFAPNEISEEKPLYDAATDTIYIYNPYQLWILFEADAAEQPVMTGDVNAAEFGIGQVIYPEGAENYLTYSSEHSYVISAQFSGETPDLIANQAATYAGANPLTKYPTDEASIAGRDYFGEVVKQINGEAYILIGNEKQLRAIGTGAQVTEPIWRVYQHNSYLGTDGWRTADDTDQYKTELYYPGDADLINFGNGYDWSSFTLYSDANSNVTHKLGSHETLAYHLAVATDQYLYCGSKIDAGIMTYDTTSSNNNVNIGPTTSNQYTATANYIIFRDIDLTSGGNWTPLMFYGSMTGAKAAADEKLWNADSTAITATARPVISNVNVSLSADYEIDLSKMMGVGFFATITNQINVNNVGVSSGTVTVSNIELNNVTINNQANKFQNNTTLVSGLLSTLGGLLGGLLDGILWLLTFGNYDLNLRTALTTLLNAREADPSSYATGAFAGRVVGDVVVSGCAVTGTVSVTNARSNTTGGFVGYATGMTEYDGLSDVLGSVTRVLTALLNVIPGLGLGDLITILLDNVVPIGRLIPTKYIPAAITNCTVSGLDGNVGSANTDYNGGFIGQQIGAALTGCTVQDSNYTVRAAMHGGGFSGTSRDANVQGTLNTLGLELLDVLQPQSLLDSCQIADSTVTVTGGSYLGGFVGTLANSYALNDTVTGTVSVDATGSYAGGFAGIATVGWGADLGKDEVGTTTLLTTVKTLLVDLLSSKPDEAMPLLSLVGISPSAILGCQVNASSVTVSADGSYAGGILGGGDGAYITAASNEMMKKLPYWRNKTLPDNPNPRAVTLTGLESVSAGEHRAGGIAGSVTTASGSGLLNGTLGLASFLGFTVSDVTVTGAADGFTVTANSLDSTTNGGSYAGGAVGEAAGGAFNNVTINNLKSVSAFNRAGGFIGAAGPGDLAGAGGLSLNILGLDNLLTVNGLLSVAQGVATTITNSTVNGAVNADGTGGAAITAAGKNENGEAVTFTAGGFVGQSNSTQITNSHVTNLATVTADFQSGLAGGFVASSITGGLADVSDETSIRSLLSIDGGLISAVTYLIPSYTNCTASYVTGGGVTGNYAGGFVADMQSGKVDNQSRSEGDYYSVYNLSSVTGRSYAGGFGGRVVSGGLAESTGGVSILGRLTNLSITANDLLGVINAYVPYVQYAGVKSDSGFTVAATGHDTLDEYAGSAGGFIGYGSGVQVSYCDVTKLANTTVTAPANLESVNGDTYFDETQSRYAVTADKYAGGFIGYMDIGSAASVGSGLKVLGSAIALTNILDALQVVVSTVEHSDVTGNPGGFAVLASSIYRTGIGASTITGHAGGFAGRISGGHIQDSNAYNFSFVISQVSAGGYVGTLEPGDVARVLDTASILGGIVDASEAIASVAQDFVPTIRNSSTTCIPCGGAVRAQAASDGNVITRGTAGGYVGHNEGGSIWGLNTDSWKNENDENNVYTGETSLCRAVRIGSVYGAEAAGGFTGLMECADTASTGSLKLLWGFVSATNLLGALSIVYPTEENTEITGPLDGLDWQTWNEWVDHIGIFGGMGKDLAANGKVDSQQALDNILSKYIYGYNVAAGRQSFEATTAAGGGAAGGYVGVMHSGTITNAQAHDARSISALRTAGGFAGEVLNGGAANLGEVDVLGLLNLELGSMINVIDVFVPVIKTSSVEGYQSGMTVISTAATQAAINQDCGYAGGFVGRMAGGQIWGDATDTLNAGTGCNVQKLRTVRGGNIVGGFAGLVTAGTALEADTSAGSGILQKALDLLIKTPSSLASVLQATVSTIRGAQITAASSVWGYTVEGLYTDNTGAKQYAKSAGGFAGTLEAAVLGAENGASTISANNLRGVIGGQYAGGFFGLADVGSVAEVAGNDTATGNTTILGLIKAGEVSVLDAFRSYVYHADVNGVAEGIIVEAHSEDKEGIMDSTRYTGNAGGFGGGLLNGSVKDSTVTNLNSVTALNYAGGFIGHLGKNGVADVDNASLASTLNLLGAQAGVLDVFGSHIDRSSVTGIVNGYVVKATGGSESVAGGFTGYSDLSKLDSCTSTNLKLVKSDKIAGGFVGETKMNYVANVEVSSTLVNFLLIIVNALVKLLYLDNLQNLGVIDLGLGSLLNLQVLSDGNLLYVNLLGLRIGVSLSKMSETGATTDVAVITLGDSTISLPCTNGGLVNPDEANIKLTLIKGNRSNIVNSTVKGVLQGYDVFGGGAAQNADGTAADGYAGGFVGLNNEGLFENDVMTLCDVVRGTAQQTGPFTGTTTLKSVYYFNTPASIEGTGNLYRIYREVDAALDKAESTVKNAVFATAVPDTEAAKTYQRYDVTHLNVISTYADLENAVLEDDSGTVTEPLNAYVSSSKAMLMEDAAVLDNSESLTPEPGNVQDPCETEIQITLQKVWQDWANIDGLRPDQIEVTITQYLADGITPTALAPQTVTMTNEGASLWSSTWSTVVTNQDFKAAYYVDPADVNSEIRYYVYRVAETHVDGYATDITYDDTGYIATITNRHDPVLPFTGSEGDLWLIMLGSAFVALGTMWYMRSKQRQRRSGKGGAA